MCIRDSVKGMRTDVVEALKKLGIPVLRWPGGCFADEYHWADGVGPKAERKRMVNTNWGGVVEDNSFGTHEFLELCAQLGCEPYILSLIHIFRGRRTGHVRYGVAALASGWVHAV